MKGSSSLYFPCWCCEYLRRYCSTVRQRKAFQAAGFYFRRPRSEHPGSLKGRQLFDPELDSIIWSVSKRGEIRMLAAGRLGKRGFGKFYLCISSSRAPQAKSFHFCIGCCKLGAEGWVYPSQTLAHDGSPNTQRQLLLRLIAVHPGLLQK
jgi:hypothetical protein